MNTKQSAYQQVRRALSTGALIRPTNCQRCGAVDVRCSDGRSRIQAHHHDYTKPLDVEWICAKCHREETPLPQVMGAPCFGEKNGQAKLTTEAVILARSMRKSGRSYQSIANEFNVDKKTAMRAIKGERWAHIAAAPQQPKEP